MRQNNRRDRRDRRNNFEEEDDGFEEKTVHVNRVTRVRKGGKRLRYNALTVVGNKNGMVGLGFGKANEVMEARRKSFQDARKNLFKVPIIKGTLPHSIVGVAGSTRVVMRPASPGTGVVAGSSPRYIFEAAGVQDVLSKIIGSRNKINAAHATINGLKRMRNAETIAKLRHRSVGKILGTESDDES